MRKLAAAALAAALLFPVGPLRAEPVAPAALSASPEAAEPTYFGLRKQTALTIAAVGTAAVVGGAVVVYSVAGAGGLVAAAGALYASHFVVEAALLAGAGGAWLGVVSGTTPPPVN
jgi:hypothetical protein